MTVQLVEPLIDALKSYLESNIVDHIQAVNLLRDTDGIVVDENVTFQVNETTQMPATPAILLLAEDVSLVSDMLQVLEEEVNVSIIAVVAHQDQNSVRRLIYRFVESITRALVAARNTPQTYRIFWATPFITYSPVYTADSAGFFVDAQIRVRLRQTESTT